MPGRNPKPTALRELEGNAGHRPLNRDEPKPEAGAPDMPKWLSKAAKKEWKAIVPILLRMGVLTKADGKALAAYCEACATWEKAQAEIEKRGVVYESFSMNKAGDLIPTGIKKNPAVTVADSQMKIMRAFAGDFGLTPVSRAKLHTGNDDQPKDPMAAFLQRRKSASSVTQ